MVAKNVCTLLLALLAVTSCANFDKRSIPEDSDHISYIGFRLSVREQTPTVDKKVERDITISGPSKRRPTLRIAYGQRERVYGVKGQYTSTHFSNDTRITKEAFDELWSNLQKAGVSELEQEDIGDEDTGWDEYIRIETDDQMFRFFFNREPKPGDARQRIRELLSDQVEQLGLDVAGEPREVSLQVKFDWDLWLSFVSESPVPLPEQYINKKMEAVTKTDDIVTIGFNEADRIEPLKGRLLRVNGDINRFSGRSIAWVSANTESTTFQGDDAEPRPVTLADIFKDPLTYHGKRVRVPGYFTPGFESMDFADKPTDEFMGRDHNVWIGDLSTFCEEGTSWQTGAITIDGTFLYGPGGHLGLWPGEIVRLTRIVPTNTGS